jgi:hypothetical protein
VNPSLLAIAAIALGQAIQVRDGLYDAGGMAFLTAAVIACAAAFVPPFRDRAISLNAVLAGGLLLQLMELFLHRPGSETALLRGVKASMFPHACLGAGALAAAVVAAGGARWRLAFWAALGAQLLTAFWIIDATPGPHMDVWWAQQGGLEALRSGASPFSSRFPDIYQGGAWYPPWARDGASIVVGFPYPPLAMTAALPSFLLTGDLRWGNAVALVLAAALVAHLTRSRAAAMAALLLVFSPRVFFVLESGWVEPVVILFFAAAVFCAVRRVEAMPLALGLAAASKQTMPLILPLVPLLRAQLAALRGRPLLLLSFAVPAVATILAVLPDVEGFVRSAFRFPAELPLRTDVLGYPAMLANELGVRSSAAATALGFGAAAATIGAMLLAAPRTAAGFAGACAAVFLAFFAFNRYAAANYYFFVIAALCCAVAAQADGEIDPLLAIT